MEFIDDGGLTDTRISGNKHQLRRAAGYDAIESSNQGFNFGFSPV